MTSQLCFTGKQPGWRHTVKFCCWCFFHFWNRVFLCCPGWPWTRDVPASWDHVWYHHTQADYMWLHMSHTTGLKTRTWCSLNLSCICYAFFFPFHITKCGRRRSSEKKKGKKPQRGAHPTGQWPPRKGRVILSGRSSQKPFLHQGVERDKETHLPLGHVLSTAQHC